MCCTNSVAPTTPTVGGGASLPVQDAPVAGGGVTSDPLAPATPSAPEPTAATDAAYSGTQCGATSTLSGGGAAIAGAAGVVGVEQILPVLQQLVGTLQQLVDQLAPGGGQGSGDVGGGNGSGGTAGQQSPVQGPVQGANQGQAPDRGLTHGRRRMRRPRRNDAAAGAQNVPRQGGNQPDQAKIDRWVTGDKEGLNKQLLARLATIGERVGEKVSITSGHRTRDEQEVLYQRYLAGTGNLAAKPGTSNHESGNAADVKIGGVSLNSHAEAARIAAEVGLHFPVPGEPWHAELK